MPWLPRGWFADAHNKKDNRKVSCIMHATRRAKERFDPDFTKKDIVELCKIVQSNNTDNKLCLGRRGARSTWIVRYKERFIHLVFDHRSRVPCTILPVKSEHMAKWHESRRGHNGFGSLGSVVRIKKSDD